MKTIFQKLKKYGLNKGMTYVELIVVLSIFSIFSGIAIFNYRDFQARVDIKNLANDMALKIVEAQKNALAGKLPLSVPDLDPPWRPSYGVQFHTEVTNSFIYFVDLNQNKELTPPFNICPASECLDKINITKGNYISNITANYTGDGSGSDLIGDLSITFTRPNSSAFFSLNGLEVTKVDNIGITVSSPSGVSSTIIVYPSGRLEII